MDHTGEYSDRMMSYIMMNRMADLMEKEHEEGTKEPSQRCNYCGKSTTEDGGALMKCGSCRAAKYCSKDCQKKDWINHKHPCEAYRLAKNGDSSGPMGNVVLWQPDWLGDSAAKQKSATKMTKKMQGLQISDKGDGHQAPEAIEKDRVEKDGIEGVRDNKNGDEEDGDEKDDDEGDGDEGDGDEKKDGKEMESLSHENDADGNDCSGG